METTPFQLVEVRPALLSCRIQAVFLDINGTVVASLPFSVDFRIVDTIPLVLMDEAPFAFALPYVANASTVQVVRNNQVLLQENITSRMLHDAIVSLPDSGLVGNANNFRKQLLHQCDLIAVDLSNGNTVAAINKMQNNIRVHLVQWLIDNYPTTSPLQYTKDGILQLVDELVQRLSSN